MIRRKNKAITHEHDPSLTPDNDDHLDSYEGYDNPIDVNELRKNYSIYLARKRKEIAADPEFKKLGVGRKATRIERIAREELREDMESELVDYIELDPYFSTVDPADYDDEIDDALDALWEWVTMSDEEWLGEQNADGTYIGNGVSDMLSYEIYEELGLAPASTEPEGDLDITDRITESDPELVEIQDDIDSLREAYAKLMAKPWSLRARRNAKKALGIYAPMPANMLRKKLKDEWISAKSDFIEAFRDSTDSMSADDLGLDPSASDDEIQATISSMLISWDIDDYTSFEKTKVETLTSKKLGKWGEKIHSGSKPKRILKYLAIGIPGVVLGLAAGTAGGFLGSALLAGAVASRLGGRYATWAGRKITDVQSMSNEDIAEYTKMMEELDGLDDSEFEDQYEDYLYDAKEIAEETRKDERNARVKTVAFVAGTILLPKVVAEIPFVKHGLEWGVQKAQSAVGWIKDHDWSPWNNRNETLRAGVKEYGTSTGSPELIFSDTASSRNTGSFTGIIDTPPNSGGSVNVLSDAAQSAHEEALRVAAQNYAEMGRLFDAHGSYPWSRAVEFFHGDTTAASNWLQTAVSKTPGAQWHNIGDGIGSNDWISVNGSSDTDTVWKALTKSMLP